MEQTRIYNYVCLNTEDDRIGDDCVNSGKTVQVQKLVEHEEEPEKCEICGGTMKMLGYKAGVFLRTSLMSTEEKMNMFKKRSKDHNKRSGINDYMKNRLEETNFK